MRASSLYAVAWLVAGCLSPADTPGSRVPGQCRFDLPTVPPQRTDILFVIDDSASMREEQEAVATQLSAFVEGLRAGNAGISLDFQVGVITTSVYQFAPGVTVPELIHAPYPKGELHPVPGSSERVLQGTDPALLEKFAALVRRGTSGSGQETPFEAIRRALSPPLLGGVNAGLLRDGSRLLLVVLSDEDDCSEEVFPPRVGIGVDRAINYCRRQEANLTSVERYHALFRDLRDSQGRRRDVSFAAIAPVARGDKRAEEVIENGQVKNVDCPTSFQPGFRLRRMAALFDPALQNLDSICSAGYQQSLQRIARLATVNQVIDVQGVPDPGLLQVAIVRGTGSPQLCTVANGGITYEEPVGASSGRIHFQNDCVRRSDDQRVEVRMLCAG